MADNLTATSENELLDAINGVATFTPPTLPLKVALLGPSTPPTDTTAGVELVGAGYTRMTIAFAAAVDGLASNTTAVQFTNLPAGTVAYWNIYDSTGTPRRLWYGPAAVQRVLILGDGYVIPAGALTLQLQ